MKSLTLICLLACQGMQAQSSASPNPINTFPLSNNKPTIYLGSGTFIPVGTTTFLRNNGLNFSASILLPVANRFGITTKLDVTRFNSLLTHPELSKGFNYINTSGTITTFNPAVSGGNTNTLQAMIGPSVLLQLRKWQLVPSLLAGYLSFTQKSFSSGDSIHPAGVAQTQFLNFVSTPASGASGFVVQPELKIGYALNTTIGFFGSVQYTLGPDVSTTLQRFIPEGQPNAQGFYEAQQIKAGRTIETAQTQKWSGLGANAGIRFTLASGMKAKEKGRLMGHELTHTVQQRNGVQRIANNRSTTPWQTAGADTLPLLRNSGASCGPVNTRTTHPDGTIEEQQFSCPDDAAAYQTALRKIESTPARISTNFTVAKQSQGVDFGQRTSGLVHRDLATRNILSGRIIHTTTQQTAGIVTNSNMEAGTTQAVDNNVLFTTGATSRKGYQYYQAKSDMNSAGMQTNPYFSVTSSTTTYANAQQRGVGNNPIYQDKGNNGTNPLHKSSGSAGKEECDDAAVGIAVHLIERSSGSVLATTYTNQCGHYFFAGVPDGSYLVEVAGRCDRTQEYNLTLREQTDLAGGVTMPAETWQHIINSNNGNSSKVQVQDFSIVAADIDGDGTFESYRAFARFSDGSSEEVMNSTAAKGPGGGSGKASMSDLSFSSVGKTGAGSGKASMSDLHFVVSKGKPVGKVSLSDLHFSTSSGRLTATATFSDGTTKDVTEAMKISPHPNVVQINGWVADSDGDGAPDLIWSPRSNLAISSGSNSVERKGQAPHSTHHDVRAVASLPMYTGDIDGDGEAEIIAGNGAAALLGGALPGGSVISAAMRPGTPIGGIIVKGGKNPSGNMRTQNTDGNGRFEFTKLEAGNYRFTVQTKYFITDVQAVELGEETDISETRGGGLTASQNGQSLRTTVPKQTQGSTFGEKVNAGLQHAGALIATLDELDEKLEQEALRAGVSTSRSNVRTKQRADSDSSAGEATTRAGISTSRSKIPKCRAAAVAVENSLAAGDVEGAQLHMETLNTALAQLQASLKTAGTQFSSISNVLKTKHDTAKNSIGNIR